ncbi:MAG TPA: class I SAM-dependent methyltransferase [Spirochaetia bacterium]|nr:class I SAM-dependent methyltransferase [Spirochaetia bacterium]
MQKPMPSLWFRLMALEYSLKSRVASIRTELEVAGIQSGMTVIDFGCGPGRYTVPAAGMVGRRGTVFAVDVHPLALKMVGVRAAREGLRNVQLIQSDSATGLDSQSVDIVLLYDALHDVEDRPAVLNELHRVLKPLGRISYKDHTLRGERLLSLMRSNGFFPVEQDLRVRFEKGLLKHVAFAT